jgi:hypothetical protein
MGAYRQLRRGNAKPSTQAAQLYGKSRTWINP